MHSKFNSSAIPSKTASFNRFFIFFFVCVRLYHVKMGEHPEVDAFLFNSLFDKRVSFNFFFSFYHYFICVMREYTSIISCRGRWRNL